MTQGSSPFASGIHSVKFPPIDNSLRANALTRAPLPYINPMTTGRKHTASIIEKVTTHISKTKGFGKKSLLSSPLGKLGFGESESSKNKPSGNRRQKMFHEPISEIKYDYLGDGCLQHFFAKPNLQEHLFQNGWIQKNAVCSLCTSRGGSAFNVCQSCNRFYHIYCLPPFPLKSTDLRVLLIHSSNSVHDVKEQVFKTGHFVRLDDVNVNKYIITYDMIKYYDAVLVFNGNNAWKEPDVLGDILAEYVDNGGGVVLSCLSHAEGLGGKWKRLKYSPLMPGRDKTGHQLTIGQVNKPYHPLMEDIYEFNGGNMSFHVAASVNERATVVARWSNGQPLCVVLDNHPSVSRGRVVSLNFYPFSSNHMAPKQEVKENVGTESKENDGNGNENNNTTSENAQPATESTPVPSSENNNNTVAAPIQEPLTGDADYWDATTDGCIFLRNALRFVAEPTYHTEEGIFTCHQCIAEFGEEIPATTREFLSKKDPNARIDLVVEEDKEGHKFIKPVIKSTSEQAKQIAKKAMEKGDLTRHELSVLKNMFRKKIRAERNISQSKKHQAKPSVTPASSQKEKEPVIVNVTTLPAGASHYGPGAGARYKKFSTREANEGMETIRRDQEIDNLDTLLPVDESGTNSPAVIDKIDGKFKPAPPSSRPLSSRQRSGSRPASGKSRPTSGKSKSGAHGSSPYNVNQELVRPSTAGKKSVTIADDAIEKSQEFVPINPVARSTDDMLPRSGSKRAGSAKSVRSISKSPSTKELSKSQSGSTNRVAFAVHKRPDDPTDEAIDVLIAAILDRNATPIIEVLGELSPHELVRVVKQYEVRTERSLESEFEAVLTGNLRCLAKALVINTDRLESEVLSKAIENREFGTLIEIITGKTPAEVDSLKETYNGLYQKDLASEIAKISQDALKTYFNLILNPDTKKTVTVKEPNLVKVLNKALKRKDAETMAKVFGELPLDKLNLLGQNFMIKNGKALDFALIEAFSGDFSKALVAAAHCAHNPSMYLANRLNECIEEVDTKAARLNRLMARHRAKFFDIDAAYKLRYSGSLRDQVRKFIDGDYQDLLLAIM